MDSLHPGEGRRASYARRCKQPQTWVMSFLYIGTFGSFIGYSFALPLVIKNTFPEFLADHPFIATYLAGLGFVGALIGSVSRPLGGWLSDRVGGARVTLAVLHRHGRRSPAPRSSACNERSFALFFGSYMVIFLLAGMGNGSTYRMIPSIFAALGRRRPTEQGARSEGDRGRLQAPGGGRDRHRRRDRRVRRLPDPGRAPPGEPRRLGAGQGGRDARPRRWRSRRRTPTGRCRRSGCSSAPTCVFAGMTWFFYLRTSFARGSRPRSLNDASDEHGRPETHTLRCGGRAPRYAGASGQGGPVDVAAKPRSPPASSAGDRDGAKVRSTISPLVQVGLDATFDARPG